MKPAIYTVATSHLDTSWHWTLERTIGEYLPKTLEENFALIEKYPDYTFSFEGAYRYALAEEYYPELFARLKEYIAQGRWRVAGSAWENGDVNIPSPEALLRNFLLGNGYFREKFGKTSCDVYLPDCFGFGHALPGIAAHANLKGFTTQKLTWGSASLVPFALGRWQGPDGGEIFACPDAHNYTARLSKVRRHYYMKHALAKQRHRKLPELALMLHGVGDKGGAPKERSVVTVMEEMQQNPHAQRAGSKVFWFFSSEKNTHPLVKSAATDDIFRDLYALPAAERNAFPVYRGEWLLSDHGTGCYTSRTRSKRWNRQAEQLAYAAEAACCFAGFLGRLDYPRGDLNEAWRQVIAHQFHDDMTGTSEEISYRRNWDDLMAAQQRFAGIYTRAVSAAVHTMDTAFAAGRCVAVSNPTQWERRESVELRLPQCLQGSTVRVLDGSGKTLPSQLLGDRQTVVFAASLPPLSLTLFDLQVSAIPCRADTGLRVSAEGLENRFLSLRLDKNGDICSLYDKRRQCETLSAPVRLSLLRCNGSTIYPAWELYYPELKRRGRHPSRPSVEILEEGPARCAIAVTRELFGSTFRQVISLDAAGTWLRVSNDIDWHSPRRLLKVEIPCAAGSRFATYDLGFGTAQRPTNSPRQYEVPAQQWADITDKDGSHGLTVLSDSKTGWDKPDAHTLRLTAVYSPRCGWRGSANVMDFGRSTFDFGLYPHAGGWQNGSVRAGVCFHQRPAAFLVPAGQGEGDTCLRFGNVSGGMVIRALKAAEDSDEWVLRVQETDGKDLRQGKISLGGGITACREIFGSEEARTAPNCAVLSGGKLRLSLSPYEQRSFALRVSPLGNHSPAAVTPVDLPLTLEPLPEGFTLPGNPAILRCRGQQIDLPPGRELSLTIASFAGDCEADFAVGGSAYTRRIYDAREPVGAGDLYHLGLSGYVKPAMPLREFTHMIDPEGKPVIGQQVRFYELLLPMSGPAAALTLPHNDAVVLLAAQVHAEPLVRPASELFDRMEPAELRPLKGIAKRQLMPLRTVRIVLRNAAALLRVRRKLDFFF